MSLPENPFTPNTQNHRLYEHMRQNRVITTTELHRMGFDTARIRDLRKELRPHLINVCCQTIPGIRGDRVYKVVNA